MSLAFNSAAPNSLLTIADIPLPEVAAILNLTTHLESLPPTKDPDSSDTAVHAPFANLLFSSSSATTGPITLLCRVCRPRGFQ